MKRFGIFALFAIVLLLGYVYYPRSPGTEEKSRMEDVLKASLPDLGGKTQSISQWQGKVLVVNFWASWCPPCRKEMPALAQVAHQLKGKVDFVGLDTQDQRSAGLAFAKSTHVHYPLAFDTVQVGSSYGVYGLPTTFFVSPSGQILGKQVGGLTKSRLLALIHQIFRVSVTQN